MKKTLFIVLCCLVAAGGKLLAAVPDGRIAFVIEWKEGAGEGRIRADNGTVGRIEAEKGDVRIAGDRFRIRKDSGARLRCTMDSAAVRIGPDATLIHVEAPQGAFSFFLRDVDAAAPIYIPDYKAVVLPAGDGRSYEQVEREILSRKMLCKIGRIETEPEASFETASQRTRRSNVPIWLGMGRDIRMFEISEELPDGMLEDKLIRPICSSSPVVLPETAPSPLYFRYALGRGVGPMDNIVRYLDEGVLPIYHSELTDDDVRYHSISFVSLERSELTGPNVRGTHFLVSDSRSGGRVFTETQQKQLSEVISSTPPPDEEAVLYIRTEIENRGAVPRYAWIKIPRPALPGNNFYSGAAYRYDAETGFTGFSDDRICGIARIGASRSRTKRWLFCSGRANGSTWIFTFRTSRSRCNGPRRWPDSPSTSVTRSAGLTGTGTRPGRLHPRAGKTDRRDDPCRIAASGSDYLRAGRERHARG